MNQNLFYLWMDNICSVYRIFPFHFYFQRDGGQRSRKIRMGDLHVLIKNTRHGNKR